MPKPRSSPRRPRTARRRTAATRVRSAPDARFWTELLSTLKELRADVQRLAAAEVGGPGPSANGRHLDWSRFEESRAAAAEGRERYWREVGPTPAAK